MLESSLIGDGGSKTTGGEGTEGALELDEDDPGSTRGFFAVFSCSSPSSIRFCCVELKLFQSSDDMEVGLFDPARVCGYNGGETLASTSFFTEGMEEEELAELPGMISGPPPNTSPATSAALSSDSFCSSGERAGESDEESDKASAAAGAFTDLAFKFQGAPQADSRSVLL